MSDNEKKYIELVLLKKFVAGEATDEEKELVKEWLQSDANHRKYFEKLKAFSSKNEESISDNITFSQLIKIRSNANKPILTERRITPKRYLLYAGGIAAALIPLIFFIKGFWEENNIQPATRQAANRVRLITGKGDVISLSDSTNTVAIDGNAVAKADSLTYKSTTVTQEKYTLITPADQTYTLVLPDGSSIWLNGNTKLEYSLPFTASERRVKLSGEAFFDVAKGKIPFVVETGDAYIKVFGTSFNINAFNPASIKTVLLTGSVSVNAGSMKEPVMLKPDQIATLNINTGQCTVKKTDAAAWLAWKTGVFSFSTANLDIVVESVAAYYKIDKVIFKKEGLKDQKITAGIGVKKDMEQMLEILSEVTNRNIYKERDVVYVE